MTTYISSCGYNILDLENIEKLSSVLYDLYNWITSESEIGNIRFILFIPPLLSTQQYDVWQKIRRLTPHSHFQFIELFPITGPFTIQRYQNAPLPSTRNIEKDTKEYISSQHFKHDFLYYFLETERLYDANETNVGWVDLHMAFNCESIAHFISALKWNSFYRGDYLLFPGCWNRLSNAEDLDYIEKHVHWRFCGGFVIGKREKWKQFIQQYYQGLMEYHSEEHRPLLWDFNFWAWLEWRYNQDPLLPWIGQWYQANHNDSLFFASGDIMSMKLYESAIMSNRLAPQKIEYDYPVLESFRPSSASVELYPLPLPRSLPPTNKEIESDSDSKLPAQPPPVSILVNTRFVDYFIHSNGSYQFSDNRRIIHNQNHLFFLSPDELHQLSSPTKVDHNNWLIEKLEMDEYKTDRVSIGLEDIRLFYNTNQHKMQFIATTASYSYSSIPKMVIGEITIQTNELGDTDFIAENGKYIQSPDGCENSWEKNWIPIVDNISTRFIYKWNPMQIGEIYDNQLKIITEYRLPFYLMNKIRGSTLFRPYKEDELIGVVHYSEEHTPRHYYHLLIRLNRITLEPLYISQPFVFFDYSIEFCIGFLTDACIPSCLSSPELDNPEFYFWISRFDRDPIMLKIKQSTFQWICL